MGSGDGLLQGFDVGYESELSQCFWEIFINIFKWESF